MNAQIPLIDIRAFASWLANGERGISSKAIVSGVTGTPVGRSYGFPTHPVDPSDFRRCEVLLREVPEARFALPLMSAVSPVWAALVAHWDELVALAESESPGMFVRFLRKGRPAPKTYARIRELVEQVDP